MLPFLPNLFAAVVLVTSAAPAPPHAVPAANYAAARSVVLRVLHAVETGQDRPFRDSVTSAAATGDVSARLALATLDRFDFRYDAAEQRLASLAQSASGAIAEQARLGWGQSLAAHHRTAESDTILMPLLASADPDIRAEVLVTLGLVRQRQVGLAASRTMFESAAALVSADNQPLRVNIACQLATVRIRAGDAIGASLAREGAARAHRAGVPRSEGTCLFALAGVYERRGTYDSALVLLDSAAMVQRSARHFHALSATLQWRGHVQLVTGAFSKARADLLAGRRVAHFTGNRLTEAWARINLAELALRVRDNREAAQEANAAARTFAEISDRWGTSVAMTFAAQTRLYAHDDAAARTLLLVVLQLQRQTGITGDLPETYRYLALLARRGKRYVEADSLLTLGETAARLGEQTGWQSELAFERGRLALARGDAREAERRFRAVLDGLPTTEPARRYDAEVRLAEAQSAAGDLDAALRTLEGADQHADAWRASLDDRELETRWLQSRRLDWDTDLGVASLIARFAGAGRLPDAFAVAERRRARVLTERVLARQALASGRPAAHLEPMTLEQVQRALPMDAAMLYYVADSDDGPTSIFVITKDAVHAVQRAPLRRIHETADRFAALVESGVAGRRAAATIAEAVVPTALLQVLPDRVKTLIVVGDGVLLRLPMALLPLSDDTTLGSRFALVNASSATLAMQPSRPLATMYARRVVAFGDPDSRATRVPGDSLLPRLPGAAQEAARAGRYGGTVRLGADATEADLRQQLRRPIGLLLVAAHALAGDGTPFDRGVVLSAGGGQDGFVSAAELASLPMDVGLVVLSGCRTDDGALVDGEGVQGLAGPLLEAGARAVLATRWPVHDAAATDFVELVMERLETGETLAEAVARAKRISTDLGRPIEAEAFVLVGDGQLVLPLQPILPVPASVRAGLAVLVLLAAVLLVYRSRRTVS